MEVHEAESKSVQRKRFVCSFFDEDVVCRVDRTGKLEFGVVVESCENASSDDEETTDSLLLCGIKRTRPGYAKIAWYPKGSTEVVEESKLKLVDRALLPGDPLSLVSASDKKGYMKDSTSSLSLKIVGSSKVIEHVPASDVEPLCPFSNDVVFLYKDGWVGYIHETGFVVTLRSPDGSVISVSEAELCEYDDVLDERSRKSEFDEDVPYVGQHFLAKRKELKHVDWVNQTQAMRRWLMSKSKRNYKVLLTVESVRVASVDVKWLCCIASSAMKVSKASWDEKQAIINGRVTSMEKLDELEATYSATIKPPSDTIIGEDIKYIRELNFFKTSNFQVGDRYYYTLKETDSVLPYDDWRIEMQRFTKPGLPQPLAENNVDDITDSTDDEFSSDEETGASSAITESSIGHRRRKIGIAVKKIRNKRLKPSKKREAQICSISEIIPKSKYPVVISSTETSATVVWQNGTEESGIPSRQLFPEHHVDIHDFFPGDYVVENKEQFSFSEYGVVQRTSSARTAFVKWFKLSNSSREPEFIRDEEVSVYDIKDHSEYSFRPGTCVIRIPDKESEGDDPAARAGQVINLCTSGELLCCWVNGTKSQVYPHELYVIGDYDSDGLWGESDADDEHDDLDSEDECKTPQRKVSDMRESKEKGTSKEIIEATRKIIAHLEEWFAQHQNLNYTNGPPVMQKMLSLCKHLKHVDDILGTTLSKSKDLQALVESAKPPPGSSGKLHALANRLSRALSSEGNVPQDEEMVDEKDEDMETDAATSSSHDVDSGTPVSTVRNCLDLISKLKSHIMNVCSKTDSLTPKKPPPSEMTGSTQESDKEEQDVAMKEIVTTNESTDAKGALTYVENVPDSHKFKLSVLQPSNFRQFLGQVRSEISILKASLPVDIVVKTFEDRMDLFSFMIKGPKNTPYEDGLFMFDVQLPSTYPSVPPVVHYLSFCSDRLNPNLYESGKVCVSLLGTWTGKGSEVWSAHESNLLQLMVSIQGLILVEEPYFNEAGYLKQKETAVGDENSRLYNEMAIVKLVQSMTKMLIYPPEVFKDEIHAHAKEASKKLITRLEKWIELSENVKSSEATGSPLHAGGDFEMPTFPLLPGSHGFCLSLKKALNRFKEILSSLNYI
ncbi:(E3-independent) E2 ubiquitin-conjugating enzyme [Halotydeus destructor]|nr:(E3-independent) E2 ubiquitin-conjugating enzyme [Halotydeus destructor]